MDNTNTGTHHGIVGHPNWTFNAGGTCHHQGYCVVGGVYK